jgi:SAM-dependent methyltransferase
MIVCPDCRRAVPCACGWTPLSRDGFLDYMSSHDRRSAAISSYIETYDLLAAHNLNDPTLSNRFVENLARRMIELLDLSGKDYCDVGSGRGYAIKYALAKRPRSVSAVDIAEVSLRDVATKYGVDGYLANAENLPFKRHFDVITATDVVEHILNVANFFVTANWALRDGGILAVRVPYREMMINYSNFYGLPMHYTHLRTFDRRLLVDLVASAGFKVNAIHYDGFLSYRTHPFIARFPHLNTAVVDRITKRFPDPDDVTNIHPLVGRLVMRPVTICAIAVKTRRLKPQQIYGKLQAFAESYRGSRAIAQDEPGVGNRTGMTDARHRTSE